MFFSLNSVQLDSENKVFTFQVLADEQNRPPKVSFTFEPAHPFAGFVVKFDASSSYDPEGKIVTYQWDFNGDGEFDKTFDSPIFYHVFKKEGSYQVTLQVIDKNNEAASQTDQVLVREPPVTAIRKISTSEGGNEGKVKVASGNSLYVTVIITANKSLPQISLGLDEDPPSGWHIRSVDKGGALWFTQGEAQWLWAKAMEPGEVIRVIYRVIVPSNQKSGLFNIQGKVTGYLHLQKFKLKVGGDSEVMVGK